MGRKIVLHQLQRGEPDSEHQRYQSYYVFDFLSLSLSVLYFT